VGSFNDEIKLVVRVRNQNESAYLAKMSVDYDDDFTLLQVTVNGVRIFPVDKIAEKAVCRSVLYFEC